MDFNFNDFDGLVVILGSPHSGKSTIIEEVYQKVPCPLIVESDLIFHSFLGFNEWWRNTPKRKDPKVDHWFNYGKELLTIRNLKCFLTHVNRSWIEETKQFKDKVKYIVLNPFDGDPEGLVAAWRANRAAWVAQESNDTLLEWANGTLQTAEEMSSFKGVSVTKSFDDADRLIEALWDFVEGTYEEQKAMEADAYRVMDKFLTEIGFFKSVTKNK
jgi:hypothetical protein